MVVLSDPDRLRALDPRFRPVAAAGEGRIVVEAPRYAQFTELVEKLAGSDAGLIEIAGNDDIFATFLVPAGAARLAGSQLLSLELDDRPGWRRIGISTKVPNLLALVRQAKAAGGALEHVYDY